jgi:hypothetical protein
LLFCFDFTFGFGSGDTLPLAVGTEARVALIGEMIRGEPLGLKVGSGFNLVASCTLLEIGNLDRTIQLNPATTFLGISAQIFARRRC